MTGQHDRAQRATRTTGAVLASIVGLLGLVALVGWFGGIDGLVSIVPGTSPIAPVTAVMLLLLAAGVLLSATDARGVRMVVAGLSSLVALAAVAIIADYVAGRPVSPAGPVLGERLRALMPDHPGLPSLWTAIALLALAVAVAMLPWHGRVADAASSASLLVVVLVVEVVATAYVFDATNLVGLFGTKPMSLLTVLLLLLMGAAVAATRPDRPPLALAGTRVDGRLVAWLVPAALVLPMIERLVAVGLARVGIDAVAAGALASIMVGLAVGLLVVWLAVSRRRERDALQAERRVAAERERYHAAVLAAPTGIVIADGSGRIEAANDGFARLVGLSRQSLIGRNVADLTHADDVAPDRAAAEALLAGRADSYRMDKRFVHPDGGVVWADLSVSVVRRPDGTAEFFVGVVSDLADRKQQERRLADAASRDPLTGLANRVRLDEWIDAWCAPDPPARTVVVFADLDRFKEVNDTLGHTVGDALLREVAVRLASAVRGQDLVARVGGDEFVVVATVAHDRDVLPVLERLRSALEGVAILHGHVVEVRVSLGLALADGQGMRAALAAADTKMYVDKRRRAGESSIA